MYATDVLLIILFAFWAFDLISKKYQVSSSKHKGNFKSLIVNNKCLLFKPDFYLVLFLLAALVSVKNSSDFYVGFFLWLKLVEFALLYFYLKTYAIRKFKFMGVFYALIAGGIFQAVIAIAQFLKQGSLGLGLLGESIIGSNMTGVASFYVDGLKIIRAYGVTPHSNILATYLFLAVVSFYFVIFYAKPKHYNSLIYQSMAFMVYGVMLFGLFFTFSRTIIFLFFFNFFARVFLINFVKRFKTEFLTKKFLKQKILPIFWVTIVATASFAFLYWPEVSNRITLFLEEEAVQLRVFYNEESLKSSISLFGIGLGDFTGWLMEQNPNLPSYMYQPVHNIYLLIYSEVGLLGLAFCLLFLAGLIYEFIKKTGLRELKHYSFLLVGVSILFIGLFDHFLLTLQQGRFVLWLSLTLLAIGDIIKAQSGNRAT